jgi:uncharacterized DUF497 family protein
MGIEFDPAKNADNIAKHGLSLADFTGFDAEPVIIVDDRVDYGETRYRAFGRIDGGGHAIVFTLRGETMRLISFRRAHEKEMRRHEQ